MKSTYCEYILEKILSTSEVGPILALIAPSPLISPTKDRVKTIHMPQRIIPGSVRTHHFYPISGYRR
jgi:hypothetical protein